MKVAGVTTFTAAQIKAEIDAIFSAHAGGNFAHAALIAATLCNHHAPELADYVRARISGMQDGLPVVIAHQRQDSSMLSTLAASDALLIRAIHAPAARAGETCRIIPLSRLDQ